MMRIYANQHLKSMSCTDVGLPGLTPLVIQVVPSCRGYWWGGGGTSGSPAFFCPLSMDNKALEAHNCLRKFFDTSGGLLTVD